MTAKPLLQSRGARLSLSGQNVLDDIDFDLFAGEVVALVGPNGAGKSTFLAALSGDVKLDSGTISINGLTLEQWKVKDLARLRSVQMQDSKVSFSFSADDVVRMGRSPWTGTEFVDHDDSVVELAKVSAETTALADRSFPTLSGGEKSRVAFARVLAQETPLIFLDEPTAAMDIRYQELVLSRARERTGAGAAVVVVLHDLSLAAAYADRIVLLNAGSIHASGTPREVLQPQILSEVYRHPVAVIDLPDSGGLVVMPLRPHLHTYQALEEELV
ncbi:heme ABC transporter ATP-binding protein [Arthrobacter psychrolactophilus]|uniref:Heme ABC transporter ATP-binding protein n=1 Tax=Arthrobacter psychrolactophilus TaxID=92442 RepID=A0A2V5IWV0_9MICC|nr:heme ABC transporter ATP-binding protein [Arthrobacter psychrolactophilus]PYI40012.1 heme ABC transporter ATP-binding protein [Arthrobacter psychrolactophilus]